MTAHPAPQGSFDAQRALRLAHDTFDIEAAAVQGLKRRTGEAFARAVQAILAYATAHADRLLELDVNPLLVLPVGRGVLAVDVLIRLADEE